MTTIIFSIVFLFIGWKLGRKYQDFQDIMLARRVAKLVAQRQQLQKEMNDWERVEDEETRYAKRKQPKTKTANEDEEESA